MHELLRRMGIPPHFFTIFKEGQLCDFMFDFMGYKTKLPLKLLHTERDIKRTVRFTHAQSVSVFELLFVGKLIICYIQ